MTAMPRNSSGIAGCGLRWLRSVHAPLHMRVRTLAGCVSERAKLRVCFAQVLSEL
jgi:hypothetical protein